MVDSSDFVSRKHPSSYPMSNLGASFIVADVSSAKKLEKPVTISKLLVADVISSEVVLRS